MCLNVLVYLTVSPRTHRRDTLAALFWPDYDQNAGRANLRRTLSILNHTCGNRWFEADREQVTFRGGDNLWLDVQQFRRLLAGWADHGHPAGEVCPACLEPLGQAAALYQDHFLTGFTLPDSPEFDDWQLFQTESLRRELGETLEKLVRGHSARGEPEAALAYARRWLGLDPLAELAHCQVMRLLALSGQRNAALTQYENCRQILAGELGVEPTAETTTLYEQIRTGAFSQTPASTAPLPPPSLGPRHNLPAQLGPFVGREQELVELARLIRDEPACRLLTLVGPGGIGKTRLAVQAAQEMAASFRDGVCFVPLAPLSAVDLLAPTIIDQLGLARSGGEPKDQLLTYLRQKELLLVLDNFEQLIVEGGTNLLLEILNVAREVKLLVTSRERLKLQEEWLVEVTGLAYPASDREDAPLEEYDAVELFLQQARRGRSAFSLSAANKAAVARICRLVDGAPLGLELAAAWLRIMSCRDIAQEIERSLDFLTTSLRNVPERHQSLRAVFDHSWRLLTEEEQAVFRQLSVFQGGFRRRAAERVAGASLALLSALVDKSLLRRTPGGRYEVHELLRQYASEKLGEVPAEMEAARNRHCAYCASFLQRWRADATGSRQKEFYQAVRAEIDNLRTGWQWAILQGKVSALAQSQESLLIFYDSQAWSQEGETAFRQALEALPEESDQVLRAQLLRGLGLFRGRLGNKDSVVLLQQSISQLRQLKQFPRRELALTVLRSGCIDIQWSKFTQAERNYRESLAIFTELGDDWGRGFALAQLGHIAFYRGEYAEAEKWLHEAASALRRIGNQSEMTIVYNVLGRIALGRGDYGQARQFLQSAVQISRDLNDQLFLYLSLRELGYLATVTGDHGQAREYLQDCLSIARETGNRTGEVNALDYLGRLARVSGQMEEAEKLHQTSLAIATEIKYRWNVALSLNSLGRLAYDRGQYRQAERYQRDSLAIWQELGNQTKIASTMGDLGYALCALGRSGQREAGQQFREALTIAINLDARPVALHILTGLAMLLAEREAGKTERERAVELLALVLHHPASEQETKDRAGQLQARLVASLPSAVAAAAQERGKAGRLDRVVEKLDPSSFLLAEEI